MTARPIRLVFRLPAIFLCCLLLCWFRVEPATALMHGETLIWSSGLDDLPRKDWWITRGSWNDRFGEGKPYDASGVKLDNGRIVLLADRVDQVGVLYSRPIPVPRDRIIHIRRQLQVHAASRKYGGEMEAFGVPAGPPSAQKPDFAQRLFGVTYQDMDYETDLKCFALLTGTNFPKGPGKYAGGQAPQIPGRWNEDFDEEIAYDPRTGDVTYQITDVEPIRAKGAPLTQPCIKLLMHSYGWGTGHAITMDYIEIFTKDGEKTLDQPVIADRPPEVKPPRPPDAPRSGDVPARPPASNDPAIREEQAGIDRLLKEMTAALEAKDVGRAAGLFRPEDQGFIRETFSKSPADMAKNLPVLAAAQPEDVSIEFAPRGSGYVRTATLASTAEGRTVRLALVKYGSDWRFSLKGARP